MINKQLKIYIFYCANSFQINEIKYFLSMRDVDFKVIGLPCSGKIDLLYLVKAFETGAAGVMLLTCKEGECHYLEGNLRAKIRTDSADALLEEAGMPEGRITIVRYTDSGMKEVFSEVDNFIDKLKKQPQGGQPHVEVQYSKTNSKVKHLNAGI